jgi:hypothetical protein
VEELNRIKSEYEKKREAESAPEENVDLFDMTFAEKIKKIKDSIVQLTPENVNTQAEELKKQVSECSDYLNQSVHFLNSYTILQGQLKMNSLLEEISLAQSTLAPRKKFAFSKRTVKKETQVESHVQNKEITMLLEGIQDQVNGDFRREDAELSQYNCFQLKNLTNCRVLLLGRLKAVHMLNLKACEIFIGPVAGAAHITECVDCKIYVAAHQIRIHQSLNTDFYIFVATNPIVESVKNVKFAPYGLEYFGIENHMSLSGLVGVNKWDQVQDFKWLKQERSPNWDILPEDIRIQKKID